MQYVSPSQFEKKMDVRQGWHLKSIYHIAVHNLHIVAYLKSMIYIIIDMYMNLKICMNTT